MSDTNIDADMERDKSLLVSDTPDVDELLLQFRRAGGFISYSRILTHNDEVRMARWHGQTIDGKKHREAIGDEPFPFEGACDHRVFLTDDIINDLGGAMSAAFQRAELQATPDRAQDIPRAAAVTKVVRKYLDRMKGELTDETRLLWNYGLGGGKAVWQVGWDRQITMREQKVTLDQVQALASDAQQQIQKATQAAAQATMQKRAQLPPNVIPTPEEPQYDPELEVFADLPRMIMDSSREEEAIAKIQEWSRAIAEKMADDLDGYGEELLENYELTTTRARLVITELREEGETKFPVPFLHKNGPTVIARRVGEDIFLQPEAFNDLQRAVVIQVRDWLSEAELRENVVTDGWDRDWVENVVKTKGQASAWALESPQVLQVDDGGTIAPSSAPIDTKSGLVEVLYAYKKYVTEDGVPQIWCTVYCPHYSKTAGTEPAFAKHYPVPFLAGKYPFVPFKRESISRKFHESRGVADITSTWQDAIKRQLDMLGDRASLEISPPVVAHNRLKLKYYPGPGSITPSMREGDVKSFPPPTGNPELAFQLIELITAFADNYFGRISDKVMPAKWQAKLQVLTDTFLGSAAGMIEMLCELIQEMADERELVRISGDDTAFPRSEQEIAGQYDFTLHFDVKNMDMDFVFKKLDAVTKMAVPLDAAGVVDRVKLVKLILNAIDPTLAAVLVNDQATASKQLFNKVQQDLALMALGNEVDYGEDADPTAQAQMQYAQQIIYGDGMGNGGNIKYQKMLGNPQMGMEPQDPIFAEKFQKWTENKQFNIQQQQNKQIGRQGVATN